VFGILGRGFLFQVFRENFQEGRTTVSKELFQKCENQNGQTALVTPVLAEQVMMRRELRKVPLIQFEDIYDYG
jgi:hypothetical protein